MLGIELDAQQFEAAPVVIWAQHRVAFDVFLHCSDQWRVVAGMSGVFYQGLDAAALAAVMDMLDIDNRRLCLQQVKQIVSGALDVLND